MSIIRPNTQSGRTRPRSGAPERARPNCRRLHHYRQSIAQNRSAAPLVPTSGWPTGSYPFIYTENIILLSRAEGNAGNIDVSN